MNTLTNVVRSTIVAVTTFAATTLAFAVERFELPADQQVHNLYIESTDDVEIYRYNDAFIEGVIKTDGRVIFTGYGKVKLNPNLVIEGLTNDYPSHVDFFGDGDINIEAPITTTSGVQTWPVFGSKLFVNADITSGGHLSITGPFGGTNIGPNVTITGNNFYSDGYESLFYMAPGSKIVSNTGIGIIATYGITIQGELVANDHIQINARGANATVNIERPITQLGSGSSFIRGGNLVNVNAPLNMLGTINIDGGALNLYGHTISTDTVLNIYSGTVNAYGGKFAADKVCIYNTFNNYGAVVEANEVCQ